THVPPAEALVVRLLNKSRTDHQHPIGVHWLYDSVVSPSRKIWSVTWRQAIRRLRAPRQNNFAVSAGLLRSDWSGWRRIRQLTQSGAGRPPQTSKAPESALRIHMHDER